MKWRLGLVKGLPLPMFGFLGQLFSVARTCPSQGRDRQTADNKVEEIAKNPKPNQTKHSGNNKTEIFK